MGYFHGIAIDVKKESGSHTDSLADADISNDAAYAAVWQFRLKGQGADVFKIKTDDGIFLKAMKSPVMLPLAMIVKKKNA